ncbi:uncharacterized protein [Drosophila takahashii]|uniref:uncharacterized protein n=1 Tax=Drosophila takahashii TaxID=29030 RepID=UPI001CF7F924|nr:uncharacterized protein LOC108065088 [Drosophila takahashii]
MKFTIIRVLAIILMAGEDRGDIVTRHTNVKCEIFDKSFVEFPVCRLKVLGRGIIGENVYIKLLKLPVKAIMLNFGIYKKLSGYHPFLINVTVDFCHYIKHPNPLTVFHLFYSGFKSYINLNHTCPYNVSTITHDIILKDFVLTDQMYAKIPLPKGSYMFSLKLGAEGVWRGIVYSYFDINVDNNPNIHF